MRTLFLIIKILTAPLWVPLWWFPYVVMVKGWRLVLAVLFISAASGCTSMSNRFDKSPCACEFKPLNTSDLGGNGRA